MNNNKHDYHENFEFVGNFVILGKECKQIKCKKTYYDFYAKRTVEAGELGGFANINVVNTIKTWIDQNYIVGDVVKENCNIQYNTKEDISHSNINDLQKMLEKMIPIWLMKVGTSEPSIINGLVWKSQLILEFIHKLYFQEETCINQESNITESDRILLWTLLGAIQEAILLIHITVFRDFFPKFNPNEVEKIKARDIIAEIYKNNDIDSSEKIVLDTINSNRNMIHFISNRPIHGYSKYVYNMEDFIKICDKLFIKQLEYLEGEN